MSDSVEEKVKAIIVEQLSVQPEDVKPEASFIDDLGSRVDVGNASVSLPGSSSFALCC